MCSKVGVSRTRPDIRRSVKKELSPLRARIDELVATGRAPEAVDTLFGALEDVLTDSTSKVSALRSEKVDRDQLQLMLDELGDDDDDTSDDDESDALQPTDFAPEAPKPKRTPHGRRPLPQDLPREPLDVPVSEKERACPSCGGERALIGHETSEVLELVPAHFKVVEVRREKVACGTCRDAVVTAPPADELYERMLAGPDLLSYVAVSKYADHLPLNRLRRLFKRMGVDLATSTLSGWVAFVTEQLEPIVERMWQQLYAGHLIQTDATGMKVLDRDVDQNIVLGQMWCYVGDRQQVVFRYTPTGDGATGPWLHLAGREGYVQADAANVFDRLFNGKVANATEVGCWFHARRRFFRLLEVEPDAARAIDFIGRLYGVDRLASAEKLDPDERRRLRDAKSRPILKRFRRWLDRTRRRHPPKSGLGTACAYVIRHWRALNTFLEDGRLPLDNNRCERQIRDLCLGRKNYLFCGSHAGGQRAAIVYSVTRSCLLNGVDPLAYVSDVLRKLAAGWPNSRLDELLPYRWAQQSEEQSQSEAA